jgi:hypothetical protein
MFLLSTIPKLYSGLYGKVKIWIKLDHRINRINRINRRTLRNTQPILFKLGSNLADEMFISKNLKEIFKIKKLIFN